MLKIDKPTMFEYFRYIRGIIGNAHYTEEERLAFIRKLTDRVIYELEHYSE